MHQPRLPNLLPAQEDAEGPGRGACCAVALPRLVDTAGAAAGSQFYQASVEVTNYLCRSSCPLFLNAKPLTVLQVCGTMYVWNSCMPALV